MEINTEDQSAKRILGCTRIKNMILDIGGVLLHANLDVHYGTVVSPKKFKRILRSNVWFSYQMGNISPDEAFSQLSVKIGCSAEELRQFCQKARAALVPITEIVELLQKLDLNLYCMTNCPAEDAQAIQKAFPDIFGRFKKIFTSSDCGMRKPNMNFFKHLLNETGVTPSETVFLDDDLANITTAESLGITSILVPSPHNAHAMAQTVKELISTLRTKEEQLSAAREYMLENRGLYKSLALTHGGLRIPVLYDHFIIAGLLGDAIYLPIEAPPERGTINFFPEGERNSYSGDQKELIRHINLPDDADTTSIGLAVLHRLSKGNLPLINTVLDKMEKDLINQDGLFQVYFDPQRPRVEPVTLVTTLYLFHLAGRGGTVTKASEEFILKLLRYRGYRRGTIYYQAPEAFLFQLARLVFHFKAHFEKAGYVDMLRDRVLERMGMEGDALTLGMRILACVMCGMPNSCNRDLDHLRSLQNVNGSWDVCPYSNLYNDHDSWFGNEAVTTAFAIGAIEAHAKASLPV